MNIFELLSANNYQAVWEARNVIPYIGEAFFPNETQQGLEFSFVKGKDGAPVALVSANFDTNVLYRDRLGVEALKGTLPFFKEAFKIDEITRQKLLSVTDDFKKSLVGKIYDDGMQLLEGARVSVERMRMQLLSTGTITVVENGVDKQYDYGFNGDTQTKKVTTSWDQLKATPFKDLVAEIKNYKKLNGENAKYIIMNSGLFEYLAADADIVKVFENSNDPYPTEDEIKTYIERKLGVQIIFADATYKKARDFAGAPVPFYPADRFTITSTADLGKTLYGTTPEEADLISGVSKASSVAVVDSGVAITTWNEIDPVNVNTKVSEVVLPTCPMIDKLYIVTAVHA